MFFKIDELSLKPYNPSQVIPGMCYVLIRFFYGLYNDIFLSKSCVFSPGPVPSGQFYDNSTLPELPSVPDTLPASSFGVNASTSDDIDFDDLSRRFEDLKKKT